MTKEIKFCECGCGQETIIVRGKPNRFIHGHAVRCISIETREKRSVSMIGVNKGNFHSEETRKKISENKIKNMNDETRRKMSESASKRKPITENTKIKMSKSHKGFKHSEESKKKMSNIQKGRIVSEESKKKMSEAKKGTWNGEKNPMWLGGISFLPYCHKFNEKLKESIRNRDNRTCQNCGIKENGTKHSVHHIHYDKENCYPDLITLCKSCHTKTNGNREYWEVYYMKKLSDRGLLLEKIQ